MSAIKVNEIFASLQGEGFNTGTAAVFVRLSGCNLKCHFCDTQHVSGTFMSEDSIATAVSELLGGARLVVLTGGEPSLFVTSTLLEKLHSLGVTIAMETNGTHEIAPGVDFVTLSPKDQFVPGADVVLSECDELKLVYPGADPAAYASIKARHRFLQPMDNSPENAVAAVEYIKQHPEWRLSLQTHKILGIR